MSRNLNWVGGVVALLGCARAVAAQNGAQWFPMPMYEPGCLSYQAALADLDGDGRLDLASLGDAYDAGGVVDLSIMYGRADASFGAPTVSTLDLYGALSIDAVDINHDGALDLLVVGAQAQCEGRIEVLLGLGRGRFGPAIETALDICPSSVALGDVDNDGQVDVLVVSGHRQSLLRGHVDGTFAAALSVTTSALLTSPQLVDIDGDGQLDLGAIANIDTQWFVQVQHGNGDGTFGADVRTALPSSARYVQFHDFDGDGFAEAVVAIWGGYLPTPDSVELLPGLGGGAFGRPIVVMSAVSISTLEVRDLDGDGRADIFAGHGFYEAALGGITWVRGLGGLGFAAQTKIASGGWVYVARAGDIDGDGDVDFVTLNVSATSEVGVVKALAPGVFDTGMTPLPMPGKPIDAAVGDLDGDGVPDLAVICEGSSEVALWRGLGNGRFASLPTLRGAAPMQQLLLEDFNGDGRADVVASEGIVFGPPSDVRVWRSTPQGFARADVYAITGGAYLLASADFDGDGRKDLAVTGQVLALPIVSVFHGRSNGTFEFIDAFVMGALHEGAGSRLLAGDFDGDGTQDLADIPYEDCVVVSYGLGGGYFGPPVCTATFEHIGLLAAGDLDLDGRDDLIMEEFDKHSGTLYALYGRSDRTLDYSGAYFADLYESPGAAIDDINGNGRPDVVALDQTSLDIITGDGQRGFDPVRGFSLGSDTLRPLVADLDLDGKLDVIVPLHEARSIVVLLHR